MTLNNATKAQFMDRTAAFSTRPSRTGSNLLGWECPEDLTPEQERDCLVARVKQLQEFLTAAAKSHPDRKAVAEEFQRLTLRINEIRPKRRAPGVQQFFLDVCRERMTKLEFDRFMNEAVRRLEKERQQ